MAAKREECIHCGAQFRAGRLACPECGSDAATGWRDADDIDYMSVEIPDTYSDPDDREPSISWPSRLIVALLVAALAGVLPFVWSMF